MKKSVSICFVLLVICLNYLQTAAQKSISAPKIYQPPSFQKSSVLQTLLEKAVNETLSEFAAKKVTANDVAATLIDLRDANNLRMGSVRGNQKIYPASVVKLFYLVALEQWLEDGKIKTFTPELQRAVRDMIGVSSNDATQFIVDVLTDSSSGAELSLKDLKKFAFKRNAVNRYFSALGFQNINTNQKTFCEDAYGREQQFRDGGKNRNMLTTDATARLLSEIVLGKTVTAERSRQMLDLLKRDFSGTSIDADDQAHGFSAIALKKLNLTGAKLWSKAGWTSKTRHDAAYIELPDGSKFVLVIFTENFADERDLIPNIAEKIIKKFKDAN